MPLPIINANAFHSALDAFFGFVGYQPSSEPDLKTATCGFSSPSSPVPHQSLNAKYPGLTIAAAELGVHRGHLHRVIRGERQSKRLLDRWHQWLRDHPEFAALHRKSA